MDKTNTGTNIPAPNDTPAQQVADTIIHIVHDDPRGAEHRPDAWQWGAPDTAPARYWAVNIGDHRNHESVQIRRRGPDVLAIHEDGREVTITTSMRPWEVYEALANLTYRAGAKAPYGWE